MAHTTCQVESSHDILLNNESYLFAMYISLPPSLHSSFLCPFLDPFLAPLLSPSPFSSCLLSYTSFFSRPPRQHGFPTIMHNMVVSCTSGNRINELRDVIFDVACQVKENTGLYCIKLYIVH